MSGFEVTCNDEQGMFVIKTSGGYSCWGYENCFRDSAQLAELVGRPDLAPKESEKGTLKQYENYGALLDASRGRDLGTWFTPGTPQNVKSLLEGLRQSKTRVSILYGDGETGMAWEEREISGTIGRSMGPIKTPLLIANRNSRGGEALLTDCIVRIRESAGKRVLYQHPTFHPRPAAPAPQEEEEAPRAPGI